MSPVPPMTTIFAMSVPFRLRRRRSGVQELRPDASAICDRSGVPGSEFVGIDHEPQPRDALGAHADRQHAHDVLAGVQRDTGPAVDGALHGDRLGVGVEEAHEHVDDPRAPSDGVEGCGNTAAAVDDEHGVGVEHADDPGEVALVARVGEGPHGDALSSRLGLCSGPGAQWPWRASAEGHAPGAVTCRSLSGAMIHSSWRMPSGDVVRVTAVVTTPSCVRVAACWPLISTQSISLPAQKWCEKAAMNFATRSRPATGMRAASLTPLPSV